jgi:16S rRNA (guanine1516-N2)-methyltransferase
VKICLVDETGAGDGALSVLAARWGWNMMKKT